VRVVPVAGANGHHTCGARRTALPPAGKLRLCAPPRGRGGDRRQPQGRRRLPQRQETGDQRADPRLDDAPAAGEPPGRRRSLDETAGLGLTSRLGDRLVSMKALLRATPAALALTRATASWQPAATARR